MQVKERQKRNPDGLTVGEQGRNGRAEGELCMITETLSKLLKWTPLDLTHTQPQMLISRINITTTNNKGLVHILLPHLSKEPTTISQSSHQPHHPHPNQEHSKSIQLALAALEKTGTAEWERIQVLLLLQCQTTWQQLNLPRHGLGHKVHQSRGLQPQREKRQVQPRNVYLSQYLTQ